MCSLYSNEYRKLKLARATMGSRLGKLKRTGRGKSIGAVIHAFMETTQGNSLCRYL
jgi:hypothetical protein